MSVRIEDYRLIRSLEFKPGAVCALVGEAAAGKSTVLEAIAASLDGADVPVELELADGATHPRCVFLRASSRSHDLEHAVSPGHAALGLVRRVEELSREGGGVVYLIEEPELYLRPHAQRRLYRLLHDLAGAGNQVIYSTHAPAFLNVARLEELVFVRPDGERGTQVHQPGPLPWSDEEFELVNEFDAERAELFLARGALLVEGRTEKLAFPFVFRALGHDADEEGISIVECGGKSRIVLLARVCDLCRIPFVAVHDGDKRPGSGEPIPAERALNELIRQTLGEERVVVLDPDFEAVSGLRSHRHKPEHALEHFVRLSAGRMPVPLVHAAATLLETMGIRVTIPRRTRRHSRHRRRA